MTSPWQWPSPTATSAHDRGDENWARLETLRDKLLSHIAPERADARPVRADLSADQLRSTAKFSDDQLGGCLPSPAADADIYRYRY